MSDMHHPHPASTCDAFPLAVALSQAKRRIAELERLLGEAREVRGADDFANALKIAPNWVRRRLAKGEQFNCYECADNEEDDDPGEWLYALSLGPITDASHVLGIEGEWRAKLIEAALRVALNNYRAAIRERTEHG